MEPLKKLIARHRKFEVDPELIAHLYGLRATGGHQYIEYVKGELAIVRQISNSLLSRLCKKDQDILKSYMYGYLGLTHSALAFGCYGSGYTHDHFFPDHLVSKIRGQRYAPRRFAEKINRRWKGLAEIEPETPKLVLFSE